MPDTLLTQQASDSRPLWLLTEADLPGWLGEQAPPVAAWIRAHAFQAEKHRVLAYPGEQGGIAGAVVGLGALRSVDDLKLWHAAGLSDRLPPQTYHVANTLRADAATHFVLGWLMGAYRMTRYRSAAPIGQRATLVTPSGADLAYAETAASAA